MFIKSLIDMKTLSAPLHSKLHLELLDLLDEAILVDSAVKGNVQLLQPDTGMLRIEVQRGFNLEFLQLFEFVRSDEASACGRAFRDKRRVMINDITKEPTFAPYVSIGLANGYSAVQSTPILSEDGNVLGIFSTHFPRPHRLSQEAKVGLDQYATQMAQVIQVRG